MYTLVRFFVYGIGLKEELEYYVIMKQNNESRTQLKYPPRLQRCNADTDSPANAPPQLKRQKAFGLRGVLVSKL